MCLSGVCVCVRERERERELMMSKTKILFWWISNAPPSPTQSLWLFVLQSDHSSNTCCSTLTLIPAVNKSNEQASHRVDGRKCDDADPSSCWVLDAWATTKLVKNLFSVNIKCCQSRSLMARSYKHLMLFHHFDTHIMASVFWPRPINLKAAGLKTGS